MYYDLDTIVQPLGRQVSAHKGMGTLQTLVLHVVLMCLWMS